MKWISVKNVLPKNGIRVLTYSEKTKKYGFCDCLKSYVLEWGNYDEITHWASFEPFEKSEQPVKEDKNIVETLKKCLNGGKCTKCEYGESGSSMMCCKDLIREIINILEINCG